jgi:hypothetical protein
LYVARSSQANGWSAIEPPLIASIVADPHVAGKGIRGVEGDADQHTGLISAARNGFAGGLEAVERCR